MPLQIRRGTNAEREALPSPFAEGEIVFITDYQAEAVSPLWIGDGETIGGLEISTGGGSGVVDGNSYKINIVGGDSTVIVDYLNQSVTADGGFFGELTGNIFTNQIDSSDSSTIVITPATICQSDLTVDNNLAVGNTVSANGGFIGSLLGNVSGNVTSTTINSENIFTGSLFLNSNPGTGSIRIDTSISLDDQLDLFTINSVHSNVRASGMIFNRSRGTLQVPAPIQPGDGIFGFIFTGQSAVGTNIAAAIGVDMDLYGTNDVNRGKIIFYTPTALGDPVERVVITGRGVTQFNAMARLATFANEAAADFSIGGSANRENGMMYYDTQLTKIRAIVNGSWTDLN
jgi:hypothetical protein